MIVAESPIEHIPFKKNICTTNNLSYSPIYTIQNQTTPTHTNSYLNPHSNVYSQNNVTATTTTTNSNRYNPLYSYQYQNNNNTLINPTPKQLAAAAAHGSFSHQSLSRNGFATGPYFRYWQDLFDLRPGRLIFALTLVYEILGKTATPTFLMQNIDDKFDWLHPTMPLGSLYTRAIGPTQPPSTVEMMYTCGATTWRNGDAAYLMKFTRNADLYSKELGFSKKTENEKLDINVLVRAVWAIMES